MIYSHTSTKHTNLQKKSIVLSYMLTVTDRTNRNTLNQHTHNKRLQSHASISSHKQIAKLFNKHLLCWGNCRFDTLAQSHASIS